MRHAHRNFPARMRLLEKGRPVPHRKQIRQLVAAAVQPSGDVRARGLLERLEALFGVVEVGDGLVQLLRRKIGELALEGAERLPRFVQQPDAAAVVAFGVVNEIHHAPVVAVRRDVEMLALGRDIKPEYLAADVAVASLLQLLRNVLGHGAHVGDDPLGMAENVMVDPLHDIAFHPAAGAQIHSVCIVDVPALYDFIAEIITLEREHAADCFQKFVHTNNSKPVGYSAVSTKYSGSAR